MLQVHWPIDIPLHGWLPCSPALPAGNEATWTVTNAPGSYHITFHRWIVNSMNDATKLINYVGSLGRGGTYQWT